MNNRHQQVVTDVNISTRCQNQIIAVCMLDMLCLINPKMRDEMEDEAESRS